MSGSGGGGGYNYQADAFAYIASYAIAGTSLNWLGRPDDIPVAIQLETGSPGDDLVVELATASRLEIQAKFHARLEKKLETTLTRLLRGLVVEPSLRAVLLVDSDSSRTVTHDLSEDLERLGQGRTDKISRSGRSFLQTLTAEGIYPDAATLSRLRIVVLNLVRGSMGEEAGLNVLRSVLEDPGQARDAWERLGKLGLQGTAQSGKSDVTALAGFLQPTIKIRREGTSIGALLHYRHWLKETFSSFPVVGFQNVRLTSDQTWDDMVEDSGSEVAVTNLADELRRYHDPKSMTTRSSSDAELHAEDLVLMREDCVIVGAAGSGKSTLVRRLVCEALEEGITPLRVPLKTLASRLNDSSLDEALHDIAFQGSGVPKASRHLLAPGLLIADGLDECGEQRAQIAEYLRSWRLGHPAARVIVATRSFGYARADFPSFIHAELEPLTNAAVFDIAQNIFTAHRGSANAGIPEAVRFFQALRSNDAASIAARTPLLLGCLAALFAQGRPLPDRRAKLFSDVTEILRDQPAIRAVGDKISETIADRVMEIAGWSLIDEPTIPKSHLHQRIGDHLFRDGLASSQLAGAALAGSVLKFWEDRRLLERLTTGTYEIVTFVHLNLAEYAAGRFAAHLDPSEIVAWIRRVHGEPRWRQPLLLAAGSGVHETVITTLLAVEDCDDSESKAALLAADAISDSHDVPLSMIEAVIDTLTSRLQLVATEAVVAAAERLITLARSTPALTTARAKPLLHHSRPVVALAAQAIIFAGAANEIPASLPKQWLASYRPLIQIFLSKGIQRNTDIPREAHDLYNRTVDLALDAMFRTTPTSEALAVSIEFFKTWQHDQHMLEHAEGLMERYGHHEPLASITKWMQERSNIPTFFNTPDHQATLVTFLDAIVANVGTPGTYGPRPIRWRYISRVLTGFGYWDSSDDNLHDEDSGLVAFAVGRTIRALGISNDNLLRELAYAYDAVKKLPAQGVLPYARPIRVQPNWKRAIEPADPERLRSALLSTCSMLNAVGADLLAAGAAGSKAEYVLREAILKGRWYTLYYLTQVAADVTSTPVAAGLFAERLSTNPDRSCTGILQALALENVKLLQLTESRAVLEPILVQLTDAKDAEVARTATEALATPKVGARRLS